MPRSIIPMAAAVLALSFGGAHAEAQRQIVIKTSDLHLSSPRDAHRLYDRVAAAASELCGRGPLTTFIPAPPPEFLACRDAAIDSALSQSHAPLVLALRKSKPNETPLKP
jgi:UrcA family protein